MTMFNIIRLCVISIITTGVFFEVGMKDIGTAFGFISTLLFCVGLLKYVNE